MMVGLVRPSAPAFIRYTVDGSEPTASSPRYEAPIPVTRSTEIKAKQYDPQWPGERNESRVVSARFVKVSAPAGLATPPENTEAGVLARVYEKKTVMWNNRGFFDAARMMLPDLSRETPLSITKTNDFQLPQVVPTRPVTEQAKGFYRFTGWFQAQAPGTYEFAVDSCGPVLLEVAKQTVIESTGIFHQQQSVRRGEAVLEVGWHPFDLIVCDPLFWNINTVDPMPFHVQVRHEFGSFSAIPARDLRCQTAGSTLTPEPALPHQAAVKPPLWLEPGLILSVYDRDGKNRELDYLEVDALRPLRGEPVNRLETNLKPGLVRRYDGWFHAPTDGLYTFNLPARRNENARLGELRAAYQNQLRIDQTIVVQRGIAGRRPVTPIQLEAGWHTLSLRLGASPAVGSVTYPDGQTLPLTADLLSRPAWVQVRPSGRRDARSLYELYAPTQISLSLPEGREGEIRYTRNGNPPGPQDTLYTKPFTVEADTTITASAFVRG
jgi:hypothetical protein